VKQPDQDIFSPLNPAYSGHPVFARHETFHPWFGWLKKGFDAATQDPEVFLREDAPVRLGVGKNMVNAIRGVAELRYDLWGQGMFWLPDLPRQERD